MVLVVPRRLPGQRHREGDGGRQPVWDASRVAAYLGQVRRLPATARQQTRLQQRHLLQVRLRPQHRVEVRALAAQKLLQSEHIVIVRLRRKDDDRLALELKGRRGQVSVFDRGFGAFPV